jgi:hypothetical protein
MGFAVAPALWSNLGSAVASWSMTLNFAAPSHYILFSLSSPPGTVATGLQHAQQDASLSYMPYGEHALLV